MEQEQSSMFFPGGPLGRPQLPPVEQLHRSRAGVQTPIRSDPSYHKRDGVLSAGDWRSRPPPPPSIAPAYVSPAMESGTPRRFPHALGPVALRSHTQDGTDYRVTPIRQQNETGQPDIPMARNILQETMDAAKLTAAQGPRQGKMPSSRGANPPISTTPVSSTSVNESATSHGHAENEMRRRGQERHLRITGENMILIFPSWRAEESATTLTEANKMSGQTHRSLDIYRILTLNSLGLLKVLQYVFHQGESAVNGLLGFLEDWNPDYEFHSIGQLNLLLLGERNRGPGLVDDEYMNAVQRLWPETRSYDYERLRQIFWRKLPSVDRYMKTGELASIQMADQIKRQKEMDKKARDQYMQTNIQSAFPRPSGVHEMTNRLPRRQGERPIASSSLTSSSNTSIRPWPHKILKDRKRAHSVQSPGRFRLGTAPMPVVNSNAPN